jgi:cardiolipin synthase (CMP-forming)
MAHREIQLHREPGLWPPTWPMGLTFLRLLLLPLFLWVMLVDAETGVEHRYRWVAVGIFAVMAITDKLDGYLARKLNQISRIGTLLDPVADKLLVASSVVLLSFAHVAPPGFRLPLWVVLAIYGKDLIVAIGCLALLVVAGRVTITARPLGKLSTFLQLSMIIATLIGPDLMRLGEPVAYAITRGLWWAVAGLAVASMIDYVIQGMRQYRAIRREQRV